MCTDVQKHARAYLSMHIHPQHRNLENHVFIESKSLKQELKHMRNPKNKYDKLNIRLT